MGPHTWQLIAAPLLAGLLLAALGGPAHGDAPGEADDAPADARVTVDPTSVIGAWEGFGCSLAWWANQFGTRDDLADLLFTTGTVQVTTDTGTYRLPGLGLNIVRYNIGGTSSAPAFGRTADLPPSMPAVKRIQGFWLDGASDDPASASFDWSADASQRAMLRKAKDRGADRFEAFSDSPMWWMCRNHSTAGSASGGDNLQSGSITAFAKYLAIVARYARDHWGIVFQTVEPFNEPSAWWWKYPGGQEGCHFDVSTQKPVLAALRAELDARGLGATGIAASDENSVDDALATWNALDADTRAKVARLNVHGYAGLHAYRGPNRPALRAAAAAAGLPVWDSEYGESDGSGATMARSMVLDINQMGVTAWVYWQPFDSGGWGLIQSNHSDNWIGPPNPKYSVMAQFSRHVRPGMTVLRSGDPDTVAAYDSAGRRLVLITLNEGKGRWMEFDLSAFAAAGGPVERWVTSTRSGAAYARQRDLRVRGRAFRAWMPPGSVQTFEVGNVDLRAGAPYSAAGLARAFAGGASPADVVPAARRITGLAANP